MQLCVEMMIMQCLDIEVMYANCNFQFDILFCFISVTSHQCLSGMCKIDFFLNFTLSFLIFLTQEEVENLKRLIKATEARNPYRDEVEDAKRQLCEAEKRVRPWTEADADAIRELMMNLWAAEYGYEEWHGENVFPLEIALQAKI